MKWCPWIGFTISIKLLCPNPTPAQDILATPLMGSDTMLKMVGARGNLTSIIKDLEKSSFVFPDAGHSHQPLFVRTQDAITLFVSIGESKIDQVRMWMKLLKKKHRKMPYQNNIVSVVVIVPLPIHLRSCLTLHLSAFCCQTLSTRLYFRH